MVKRRLKGGVASALVALYAIACNAIGGISEHEAASGGTAGAAPSGSGGSIVRGSGGSVVMGAGGKTTQGGRDGSGGEGGGPSPMNPEGGAGPMPDGTGGVTGLGGSPPMPAGGEGGVGPVCVNGTRACQGNVVVECDGSGEWIALPIADQCGGSTPACSGAGTCAALRLRSGSIETFGVTEPPPATSKYVLREQTLLTMPRACSATYCVTGGMRP